MDPIRIAAWGTSIAAATYGVMVAASWWRYGRPQQIESDERDSLLDRFLPAYDVAERHHVAVAAPATLTLAVAKATDLQESAIVWSIFRARELLLGGRRDVSRRRKGLLAEVQSLGWGILADAPGREIVMGAVTQPWLAKVVFRALPPEEFEAFREPGYVKIAWTLRADATSPSTSVFRTETRMATTDTTARHKFRWYWARFSPGILLIRQMMLRVLKAESEQRAQLSAESDGRSR